MNMTARRGIASFGKTAANKATDRYELTDKLIKGLVADVESGRIPLPKIGISDHIQQGLRVVIRNSGLVTFHSQYELPSAEKGARLRPHLKIGDYPDMSIDEARSVNKTVQGLAAMGIDPQDGLHDRLVRELKKQGTKWRP